MQIQKMKNTFSYFFLIAFVATTNACSHTRATLQSAAISEKANFTKATIINYTLDGCGWMLQLDDEKKLQPVNLNNDFKKENLKVWIQYQPVKQGNSICMAGDMVTITAIEIRK